MVGVGRAFMLECVRLLVMRMVDKRAEKERREAMRGLPIELYHHFTREDGMAWLGMVRKDSGKGTLEAVTRQTYASLCMYS